MWNKRAWVVRLLGMVFVYKILQWSWGIFIKIVKNQ